MIPLLALVGCRTSDDLFLKLQLSPEPLQLVAVADSELPVAELTVTNAGPNETFVRAAGFEGQTDFLALVDLPEWELLEPGQSTQIAFSVLNLPQAWISGIYDATAVIEGDALIRERDGCGSRSRPAGRPEEWRTKVQIEVVCDADGDGHDSPTCGGDDCDDANPTSSPTAPDICNDFDDDCDDWLDEDAEVLTWYADTDDDGYGDAGSTVEACAAPDGHVADATDCDDAMGTIHPGADEYCDGQDNDCDGITDPETSLDQPTWYDDDDGDGYGDLAQYTQACEAPRGRVADSSDCDDTNDAIHPDALELCDHLDNDCDGLVDGADADGLLWYADADGDGYGDLRVTTSSCTAPGGYVRLSGDCDDSDRDVHPGAAESNCSDTTDYNCDGSTGGSDDDGDGYTACEDCDDTDAEVRPGATELCASGVDEDCDSDPADCTLDALDLEDALAWITGSTADDQVGPVASGDLNGDGFSDIIVGAPGFDDQAGAAAVFLGPLSGGHDLLDAHGMAVGLGAEGLGSTVTAFDTDGDGYDDVLASAPKYGGDDEGAVFIFAGPAMGIRDLDSSNSSVLGAHGSAQLASALSTAGDFSGDGRVDVLLGASAYSLSSGSAEGSAFVVSLPEDGSTSTDRALLSIVGGSDHTYVGSAVAGGTDLDGDGQADIVIGAYGFDWGASNVGAIGLFLGGTTGIVNFSDADGLARGGGGSDLLGTTVVVGGDLDGDGLADIVAGAPGVDDGWARDVGAVYVFTALAYDTQVADEDAVAEIVGGDELGGSLAWAGDLLGDGSDDLLAGMPGGTWDNGSATVLLGPLSGSYSSEDFSIELTGEARGDEAGAEVSGAGDVDGDGSLDLLVGAPGTAEGGTVYLVSGGGT